MNHIKVNERIFLVEDFLTPEECQFYIQFAENKGFEEATIDYGTHHAVERSIRNNLRVIHDDFDWAKQLWEKLAPYKPTIQRGDAIGLNERFRIYKYFPGHRFRLHRDGRYVRNANEWSAYTFMVYLNEVEKGGATRFIRDTFHPKTGMALVFAHHLPHEGMKVEAGVKYVLRSDVMFRRNKKKVV